MEEMMRMVGRIMDHPMFNRSEFLTELHTHLEWLDVTDTMGFNMAEMQLFREHVEQSRNGASTGKKIQAIKAFRERTGRGLGETVAIQKELFTKMGWPQV